MRGEHHTEQGHDRPRRKRTIGVILFLVALIGGLLLYRWLGPDREEYVRPTSDPWYHLVSNEFVQAGDARELDRSEFAVVTAGEPDALARLDRSAWVELTSPEVEAMIGKPLGGSGGHLVLLRGLAWDTPNAGFTVAWRPGAVRVSHGCLGRHAPPVVRRAVVARLPDLPSEVFADLIMAE